MQCVLLPIRARPVRPAHQAHRCVPTSIWLPRGQTCWHRVASASGFLRVAQAQLVRRHTALLLLVTGGADIVFAALRATRHDFPKLPVKPWHSNPPRHSDTSPQSRRHCQCAWPQDQPAGGQSTGLLKRALPTWIQPTWLPHYHRQKHHPKKPSPRLKFYRLAPTKHHRRAKPQRRRIKRPDFSFPQSAFQFLAR